MMLVKFLLKVLAIVVIVPVFIFMIAVKLLVNLSSYILWPFMLFLIGCAIYTIIQSAWNQLLILAIMIIACVLALFGASWVIVTLEDVSTRLKIFVKD